MVDPVISPELRNYYVWWLGQIRNHPESSVRKYGLCAGVYMYAADKCLTSVQTDMLYQEQIRLFGKLYVRHNYPFGGFDWTFKNPKRMAHVERFAISPKLRQFYRDWLRLSATRADRVSDQDRSLHNDIRHNGLCLTFRDWLKQHKADPCGSLRVEQNALFGTLYGHSTLPFNNGDIQQYLVEGDRALLNQKRRAHVKRFAMPEKKQCSTKKQ